MIRIAVCDDEKELLNRTLKIVTSKIKENRIPAQIDEYQNGDFLLADVEEGKFIDLFFLDIEMPGKSGMEIAKKIKSILPHSLIVFVTSHQEYVFDSFELSVFRFIPKEQLEDRMEQLIKDAFKIIMLERDDSYVIETQNRIEKILNKDILYIQKSDKNSIITTFYGESKVRKNLAQVFSEINREDEFVYIDRGCIVNILHIMQIVNGEVEMKNGVWLSVSRSHRKGLRKLINEFWGKAL